MEKETTENKEVKEETAGETAEQETPKKKLSINPKIFIIGLPLFIVQLVAVYFITANILLSKVQGHTQGENSTGTEEVKEGDNKKEQPELGKFIFTIEDIIVNPAGTEGKRLLLASIGFDISTEEEQQILKSKEVLLKDIIISKLSSKSLDQLSNSAYKDTLKNELAVQLRSSIPTIKLNNVYLSKFIIQ